MNDLALKKSTEITDYKPVESLQNMAKAEVALKYYQRGNNLEGVRKAVEVLYTERFSFVNWWDANKERGRPEKEKVNSTVNLSDLDLNSMQVSRWRTSFKDGYENAVETQYVKIARHLIPEESTGGYHITSGENDWYTPQDMIESARLVMGSIDLDPASSDMAQESINAGCYYTKESSGLDAVWTGNTWMNPPYSMPEIEIFIDKLLSENVTQWIVLTNNSSDTGWFHKLLEKADQVCFTKGRVRFTNPSSETMATRQGQTFFYHGDNHLEFAEEFKQYGAIMEVIHDHSA